MNSTSKNSRTLAKADSAGTSLLSTLQCPTARWKNTRNSNTCRPRLKSGLCSRPLRTTTYEMSQTTLSSGRSFTIKEYIMLRTWHFLVKINNYKMGNIKLKIEIKRIKLEMNYNKNITKSISIIFEFKRDLIFK